MTFKNKYSNKLQNMLEIVKAVHDSFMSHVNKHFTKVKKMQTFTFLSDTSKENMKNDE